MKKVGYEEVKNLTLNFWSMSDLQVGNNDLDKRYASSSLFNSGLCLCFDNTIVQGDVNGANEQPIFTWLKTHLPVPIGDEVNLLGLDSGTEAFKSTQKCELQSQIKLRGKDIVTCRYKLNLACKSKN